MTKAELATLIMENTDQYKKSHLAKMHLADLEQIAAPYLTTEATATSTEAACTEQEATVHTGTPESAETREEKPIASSMLEAIEQAYEDNAKIVKGPRVDKTEFRAVTIEKTLEKLAGDENPATICEITIATMKELLHDKTAFCPINNTESLMLATIPHLADYEGVNSIMDGKGFLAKVKELHGVEPATSRALMVSLCRKGFYRIIGVKSGQKHTTIQLQERGIRHLNLNQPA